MDTNIAFPAAKHFQLFSEGMPTDAAQSIPFGEYATVTPADVITKFPLAARP